MQINLLNPVNLINPVAEVPAVKPAPAIGTRNQTNTAQTGTGDRPAILVNPKAGEIKLNLPGGGETEDALSALSEAVQALNIRLNFSRDDETGSIVIKLVDQSTGETVQQIPQEALLHLSAALGKLQGKLFDQQA